jgi:hypothetical protein
MFDDEYDDEERKEEDIVEIDLGDDELDGQDITEEDTLGMTDNRYLIFNIFIVYSRSP